MSFWDKLRRMLRRAGKRDAMRPKVASDTPNTETWTYPGAGIFYRCQLCGGIHEADQPDDFLDKVARCSATISASTQDLYRALQIPGEGGRWNIAPQEATFVFTRPGGEKCFADYGLIGSWNPETCSWLWAWHMPDFFDTHRPPETELTLVRRLREHGAQWGWQPLTEPLLYLGEPDSWHMADLAADLAGWPMVYRAKVNDSNYHYFAISRPVVAS